MKRFLPALALTALLSVSAYAGFDEGKAAYDKKDWLTTIKELRPLAEAGDDRAMILLANMYSQGYGVAANADEAMGLYKRAAAKNNPQAMVAIGAMYTSGIGVPENNFNTALAWFQRAAKLGDQQGAFMAGLLLARGNRDAADAIKPDLPAAYELFRRTEAGKTSEKFSALAKKLADGLAANQLKPEQVAAADKAVAAWKPADVKDLGPLPADPPLRPKKTEKKSKTPSPPPESQETRPPAPAPSPQ